MDTVGPRRDIPKSTLSCISKILASRQGSNHFPLFHACQTTPGALWGSLIEVGHRHAGVSPVEAAKPVRAWSTRTHKERLRELALLSLDKSQLWGDHSVWALTALTGSAASSPSLLGVWLPALKDSSDIAL